MDGDAVLVLKGQWLEFISTVNGWQMQRKPPQEEAPVMSLSAIHPIPRMHCFLLLCQSQHTLEHQVPNVSDNIGEVVIPTSTKPREVRTAPLNGY